MRCTFLGILAVVCLCTGSMAQPILMPDRPFKSLVAVSAHLRAEGWGLGVERGLRFYQRGFLDSAFLAETLVRMPASARFGIESTEQILGGYSLDSIWKKQSVQVGIDIRNTAVSSGSFQRDLFELIFLGNQNFIGKTISGDGFYLRSAAYRTWAVWASKNFALKNHLLGLHISLGWVQGVNLSNRLFPTLQFTTQAQASALGLAIDGDQQYLKDRNKAFLGVNGNGLSFSGNLKWETPSHYKIVVHWEDFGWVNWRKVTSERWDTAVQFTGFSLDASTLLNSPPKWNTDSIWQVSKGEKLGNQNVMLPFLWSISVEKVLSVGKWGIFSNARQRIGYQRIPWIQAGVGYNLGAHRLEASLGGGGQGGYGIGAGWILRGKKINLHCILQLPLNGLGKYAMSGLQAGASILYRFGD